MTIDNKKDPDFKEKDRQQNGFNDKPDFDSDDDRKRRTQLNLESKYLRRAIVSLNRAWDKYTDIDPKYWWHDDTNKQYLHPDAKKASQDAAFVWQAVGNYIIDWVLFHNVVDFMIRLGVPNSTELLVLVTSCIFPIGFFFGEFHGAQIA